MLENNNLFKNNISEYELLVNYHNYGNFNNDFNNYYDFEINNYYDNSHLSKYSTEILYDLIIKKFPTFAVRFSEINTNPIIRFNL